MSTWPAPPAREGGENTEIQGSAGKKCGYWGLPSLYCVSVTVSHSTVFSVLVSSRSLLLKSLGEDLRRVDLVPLTSEQPSELLGLPDTAWSDLLGMQMGTRVKDSRSVHLCHDQDWGEDSFFWECLLGTRYILTSLVSPSASWKCNKSKPGPSLLKRRLGALSTGGFLSLQER